LADANTQLQIATTRNLSANQVVSAAQDALQIAQSNNDDATNGVK
jgi:hypothetical protein